MLVTCTNCQSKIKVPDAAAGKKGKCPKCGTIIAIPALDAADAPAPAEAPAGGSPFDFDAPPPAPAPVKKGRKPVVEEVDDDVVDADDEDDARPSKKKKESTGLSITSLVLGIVSLLSGCGGIGCCCFAPVSFGCAIAALITGYLGMNKGGRTMAIVGMSLGGLSLLLAIGGIIFAFVGAGFQQFLNTVGAH